MGCRVSECTDQWMRTNIVKSDDSADKGKEELLDMQYLPWMISCAGISAHCFLLTENKCYLRLEQHSPDEGAQQCSGIMALICPIAMDTMMKNYVASYHHSCDVMLHSIMTINMYLFHIHNNYVHKPTCLWHHDHISVSWIHIIVVYLLQPIN